MDDLNLEVAQVVAEARRVKVLTRYEARKLMLPALGLEDQDKPTRVLLDALQRAEWARQSISQQGLNPQAEAIQTLIVASGEAYQAAQQMGLVDEVMYMTTTTMASLYGCQNPDTSETGNF